MLWPKSNPPTSAFTQDLKDVHLIYNYSAQNPSTGAPESWKYEMYFSSPDRIIYAIHGGPMAGRKNYQTADYQCIRPGELWQVNWLEETGTICSLVYDIPAGKVTTLISFSQGHWERPGEALGDKRDEKDFERWRGLAGIGRQTDRHCLHEQGTVVEKFKGRGDLEHINEDWPTL